MDIRCPACGEPLDNDELHDVPGMTYAEAVKAFRRRGCKALGFACAWAPGMARPASAQAAAVLMDVLGDDMDGVASMLEDFEYAGLI